MSLTAWMWVEATMRKNKQVNKEAKQTEEHPGAISVMRGKKRISAKNGQDGEHAQQRMDPLPNARESAAPSAKVGAPVEVANKRSKADRRLAMWTSAHSMRLRTSSVCGVA